MNNFSVIGRLIKIPELRRSSTDRPVMRVDLAINNGKDDTTFLPIKVFGAQAENIAKYLHKGSQVAITGIIKNNNWEQDGVKHYDYNFIARTVEFLSGKPEEKKENKDIENSQAFTDFGDSLEMTEEDIAF